MECKAWVKRELEEANKALNYLLSQEQMKEIQSDTHHLREQLGSLIDEYSIVKPDVASNSQKKAEDYELTQLTLSLKDDMNSILNLENHYSEEKEYFNTSPENEVQDDSDEPLSREEKAYMLEK